MDKEMIGMILAGGQGSRLGVLTKNTAKPAILFGGKYRIIDFTISNCINSGIDTIGVLTQYEPLKLNRHIGIGIPWDLDRNQGGITILSPRVKGEEREWYNGTANSIYQNIDFIDQFHPKYIAVLSGDHVYKMNYTEMLRYHKSKEADATIAVLEVPMAEAHRFGIMNTDSQYRITSFEEKPKVPKNNLASMGIYIFNWPILKQKLIEDKKRGIIDSDFGKHIIPRMLKENYNMTAYHFKGYWKDVGTIESYWEAQMELTYPLPEFNLYDEAWKIYTKESNLPPQYLGKEALIRTSIVPDGCRINGGVYSSVLSQNVTIEEDVEIYDSIIMKNTIIKKGSRIYRSIIGEDTVIESNCIIGTGEERRGQLNEKIYNSGITVVGEKSFIPSGVTIGKNCVIFGATTKKDYKENQLASGHYIVKEEGQDIWEQLV